MKDLKIFAKTIEQEAIDQIELLLEQKPFQDCKVRIMPDAHAGAGCVIGFTANMGDKIIPDIVGVDIGCFTGDTKIPLLNGSQKTLKELSENKEGFFVYAINENKMIVPGSAIAFKTRKNAELVLVRISGGGHIKCTPDHLFLLRDGTYKQAKDLRYKDSLMPFYRRYQTRDGYESIFNPGGRSCLTHKMIAEYCLGKCPRGYIAHHKNLDQFDNTPDNLVYIATKEHNSIHGKISQSRLKTNKFKQQRIAKLEKNGYYNKKFTKKKKEVGTKNFMDYMKNNPIEFAEVVKQNAARGSKYFSVRNAEPDMVMRQKLGKIRRVVKKINESRGEIDENIYNETIKEFYNYPKYEKSLDYITQIGFHDFGEVLNDDWDKIIYNNHKVISVTSLEGREDVYCLSVDKYHNFALADGVFVHNCGMLTVDIGTTDIDFNQLDSTIRERVPSGRNVHEGRVTTFDQLQELKCFRELKDTKRMVRSVGTLGGGNHFIEVDKDAEGNKYLIIHTGSRNLGKQVADYYQNLAYELMQGKDQLLVEQAKIIEECKLAGRKGDIAPMLKTLRQTFNLRDIDTPKALCYLQGEYRDQYLHDMRICQEFSVLNRKWIAKIILDTLHIEAGEEFETIHNYIDLDTNIVRKGAINADKGKKLLIPINMRDGCILGVGKGNADWNKSAPHGAGRLMSRRKAKETYTLQEFQQSMEGIFTTSVVKDTIDEAPMVYKDIDEIIECIEPTVEIIKIIKPVYNFKASE